jgi:hypothetical protein
MLYELKLIDREDGLVDLYLNERVYKAITKDEALQHVIDADNDFIEADSKKK